MVTWKEEGDLSMLDAINKTNLNVGLKGRSLTCHVVCCTGKLSCDSVVRERADILF